MEGTITSGGAPVADARVSVADIGRANPCLAPEQSAVTSADGRFSIAGRRRIRILAWVLPVHAIDTWAVAVAQNGKPVGYVRPWNYRAGPRHAPERVDLDCDVGTRSCELHDRSWNYRRTLPLKSCDEFASER